MKERLVNKRIDDSTFHLWAVAAAFNGKAGMEEYKKLVASAEQDVAKEFGDGN